MRPLLLSRPLTGLVYLLIIAQLACGLTSTPTPPPPSPTPTAAQQPAQQATEAAPPQSTQPAAGATSTGQNAASVDAQSMLSQAVQHYQSAGREQALKDFNEKKAPFNNSDLSVLCLGSDHKLTALGAFPMLVGTSADSLKDSSGLPLGQVIWDAVAVAPQGSVPFHWKNPLTGQEESKTLYYQKLDQDVCGVATNQP